MHGESGATDSATSLKGRWYAAILLTAIFAMHSVDRFVISVVLEPLRHEFGLTDTQLGTLGGFAHALAYSVFVLPIGWLLDRVNRVRLLSAMLALWSVITTLGALATGYWTLFLMRMGVGGAEAATSPSMQSLIASMFPVKERASAMGVVWSGVAIGTGLVFAVGGVVAENWGWRAVFLMAGVPGLLLAAVLWLTVREPPRAVSGKPTEAAQPFGKALAFVARNPPILFSTVGLTIASMSVSSVWVWVTPILIRQQDFSLTQAGLLVGIAAGVVKFVSTVGSGFLADRIAKGRIDKLWVVPTVALTLSAPLAFGIAYAPSQLFVVVLVMALGLMLGTHYSAPRVVIVTVAPDHMRGSITAIEQLMVNLLGAGLGPLLTGAISDYLGGDEEVGLALAATVSLNVVGALCFWLASRGVRPQAGAAAPA